MNILEKHHDIVELYEMYYPLLTSKQQTSMSYYYLDNYSLSEIAEIQKTTRNAVHDLISRTTKKLYAYEQKLALREKHITRLNIIDELKKTVQDKAILALIDALEKVE